MRATLSMLAVCALAGVSLPAESVDSEPVRPVYVEAQCDADQNAKNLVFKIKDGIRKSASMSLADENGDWLLKLSLVCLKPTEEEENLGSRFSYTVTLWNADGDLNYFVGSGVAACGAERLDGCADGLIAFLDEAWDSLKTKTLRYPKRQ